MPDGEHPEILIWHDGADAPPNEKMLVVWRGVPTMGIYRPKGWSRRGGEGWRVLDTPSRVFLQVRDKPTFWASMPKGPAA